LPPVCHVIKRQVRFPQSIFVFRESQTRPGVAYQGDDPVSVPMHGPAERPRGSPMTRPLIAFLALTVALLPTPVRADNIDDRLLAEAGKVLKYLKDHKYQNIGVLKFRVQKGTAAPSMNAGPLNAKMAARLENALILLNDPAKPITVLHDVTREANSHGRSATLANPKGRRGLLNNTYPVAWGSDKKQPDALLTGDVILTKDMTKATVVVKAFDKAKPEALTEVLRLRDIPLDRDILASAGQSFVASRSAVKRGARSGDDDAIEDAANRDESGANPLGDSDDPVKLEVTYDGEPVVLEPDTASPGELKVKSHKAADPKEGQKVKFVIRNTSPDTVGVVLAINGKSALFLEDLVEKSPGECTKWILAPGEAYTIEGFYMTEDGKEIRPFKVLSDEESVKAEFSPEHKGVFALHVFRAGSPEAAGMNIGGELARKPKGRGKTLADAQAALAQATKTKVQNGHLVADKSKTKAAPPRSARQGKGGRGLVVDDAEAATSGTALNRVEFTPDPQPAMSLFIRYYNSPVSE
jgi:hypothetical protein